MAHPVPDKVHQSRRRSNARRLKTSLGARQLDDAERANPIDLAGPERSAEQVIDGAGGEAVAPHAGACIATELRELGRAYQMPVYVWLGEHIDGTVAAARNDPDGVRRHALTGLELARQYRMGEAEAVNLSTLAMLDHVQGRFDEAERGYAQLGEQLMRLGAINAAGFHALARMTVCLGRQRYEDLDAALQDVHAQVGSPADDVYAYALTVLGRHDEARAVDRSKPVRPDYFHGFFLTVRVEAALALGELDRAAALAPHLVPVQDQLAGAATTSLAVWPVALTLGRLHRALGDETAAQEQFARAGQVARAWRSAHWAAEADRLAGREVRSK
jgi:tetratricopeptide (TPR) repeat protein